MIKGRIHSFQSMGAVDGPGLRYVVFLQGCPLRCAYCHNPDTWDIAGESTEYSPQEVLGNIQRYRSYFGRKGGVTVSGGEPLMQPEFTAGLFRLAQEEGIHTALDTSCALPEAAPPVLEHTNLILADVKFLSEIDYQEYCGGSFDAVVTFLNQAAGRRIPVWIRHVVVPGITDGEAHIRELCRFASGYPNVERIDLLPFSKLCEEKYQNMGIPFPLAEVPAMDRNQLAVLEGIRDAVFPAK